jgi:hypothetical protein
MSCGGKASLFETVRERHGGEFPGDHARYVLRSRISPIMALLRAVHGVAMPNYCNCCCSAEMRDELVPFDCPVIL